MINQGANSRPWRAFNVLVVSPTPTHPQDHGNRKRIYEICTALKQLGASIHFVHYPSEHDWRHARPARWEAEMRAAWDGYQLVPPTRPLHSGSLGLDHGIDEWSDPALEHYIAWVCRIQHFDMAIVNYTWMSFCLDAVPPGVFKVCDTHDVFGNRRALLESQGISPEFFHTTPDEEARGLRRADLVWAIKDSERTYFADVLELPNCLTMLHAEPEHGWWTHPPSKDGWLRAGVIGARNNINKKNLERFLTEALPIIERYMAPIKIVIAGSCSDDFRGWTHPNVEVLGRVAEVTDFYKSMDVVIAPMQFSTGLKIKVAEALSSGAPLVSHAHAMEGYPTREPLHLLPSFSSMAMELVKLSFDRDSLSRLAKSSRTACYAIRESVLATLEATRQQIMGKLASTICVIAPMMALDENCLLHDHLYAAMDYLRFSAQMTLYVIGTPAKVTPHFLDQFEQRIRVFADPGLMAQLGDKVPEEWSAIELGDLLETRGFERAYIAGDCGAQLMFGVGRLREAFVRHDSINIGGGNADDLIDTLRTSVNVTVLSSDIGRLMHWKAAFGVGDVVQIPFRRSGSFISLMRRTESGKQLGSMVVLGRESDPLVQELVGLAGQLGRRALVLDLENLATATEICFPTVGIGPPEDKLAILGSAALAVFVSPHNSLSLALGEALERAGIPNLTLLRGIAAAAMTRFPSDLYPPSVGCLLKTVARCLTDFASLNALQVDGAKNLHSRISADAGWTWLWHRLTVQTLQVEAEQLTATSELFELI